METGLVVNKFFKKINFSLFHVKLLFLVSSCFYYSSLLRHHYSFVFDLNLLNLLIVLYLITGLARTVVESYVKTAPICSMYDLFYFHCLHLRNTSHNKHTRRFFVHFPPYKTEGKYLRYHLWLREVIGYHTEGATCSKSEIWTWVLRQVFSQWNCPSREIFTQ